MLKHRNVGSVGRAIALLALLFPLSFSARGQVAGWGTLELLGRTPAARTAGLGMDWLPLFGDDPVVAIDNPSLATAPMSGTAVASVATLFAGGSYGTLAYVQQLPRMGALVGAFRWNNYGRFRAFDEEEVAQGEFAAADYALAVGYGLWLDSNFSFGVTAKPVLSQYEDYRALAIAFDLAASFTNDSRRLTATLMARNFGAQLMTFDGTVERLPYELAAAVSYKLSRAPFRLFVAANDLQRWNLRYDDPLNPTSETDPFTGEVEEESTLAGLADNLLRHVAVGVEVSLGKPLFVRVGYNYRQGQEMRGAEALNLSGFSFGFGLHTRRLDLAFSRRNYHLTQAPNYFTVSYKF